MSSDIILEDNRVRIVDSSLDVESAVTAREGEFEHRLSVRSDESTTSITDDHVYTDRLFADRVSTDSIESDEVQVGSGNPGEHPKAGTATVNDEQGDERIYLNGGTGDSEDESGGDGSPRGNGGGGGGSSGGPPWRYGGGWQRFRIPKIKKETLDAMHEAVETQLGEQDERADAPDTVRVYVEGDAGSIGLGGDGVDGDLVVTDGDGETVVHVDGDLGDIKIDVLDEPIGETINKLEARIAELERDQ